MKRFKRGDISKDHPGLVFFCYSHNKEKWVTPQEREAARVRSTEESRTPERKAKNKAYRQTPAAHQAMLKRSAQWREKHPDRRKQVSRDSAKRNRAKTYPKINHRYRTDPWFNLRKKVARRIYMGLRQHVAFYRKSAKTIDLLGCSYEYLKQYIESKFTGGMTWDHFMRGEIELDHIKRLASFDLTSLSQQLIAFNFTNLQPLWTESHKQKSANEMRTVIPFKQSAA